MNYERDDRYIAKKSPDIIKNNIGDDQLRFATNTYGAQTIKDGLGRVVESEIPIHKVPEIKPVLPDFVDFDTDDMKFDEVDRLVDKADMTYYQAKRELGIDTDERPTNKSINYQCSEIEQNKIDAQLALDAIKYYSHASRTNGQLDCILNGHPMAGAFNKKSPNELEEIAESQRSAGDRRLRKIIGSNVLKMIGFDINATDSQGNKLFNSSNDLVEAIHDKYYPSYTSNEIKSERAKLRRELNKILAQK